MASSQAKAASRARLGAARVGAPPAYGRICDAVGAAKDLDAVERHVVAVANAQRPPSALRKEDVADADARGPSRRIVVPRPEPTRLSFRRRRRCVRRTVTKPALTDARAQHR